MVRVSRCKARRSISVAFLLAGPAHPRMSASPVLVVQKYSIWVFAGDAR